MSEQVDHGNLTEGEPELDAILYEFSNGTYQYYHWLGYNIMNKQSILAFNHEATQKTLHISSAFARTAIGIDQYFEDQDKTRKFLAAVWVVDEKYRTSMFSTFAPGSDFTPYSSENIERKIARLQAEEDFGSEVLYDGIKEEYGDSLGLDVDKLLSDVYSNQESTLRTRLVDMPLSEPNSTHEGLQLDSAKCLSDTVAKHILRLTVDNQFVKYAHRD